MKNIILIGMPGAGKSTVGVLLAKALGLAFVDTDLLIQQRTGELLQQTLQKRGVEGLLDEEEAAILSLDINKRCVAATGGSAVLREASMTHLKRGGICVYLSLPYATIARRIHDRDTRGIAADENETLKDIYEHRAPFYEKYADITVDCRGKSPSKTVEAIKRALIELV